MHTGQLDLKRRESSPALPECGGITCNDVEAEALVCGVLELSEDVRHALTRGCVASQDEVFGGVKGRQLDVVFEGSLHSVEFFLEVVIPVELNVGAA